MIEILRRDKWDSPECCRPFLVVGYYTDGTPYQHEAEPLKLSLETMLMPYEICAVPNLGSWQKNTQMKAEFIKMMLEEHPGCPLLYLDMDATVMREPEALMNVKGDIAAVHYAKTKELLSGTVYWANTPVCHDVIRRWIEFNRRYPDVLPDGRPAWDQRTLEKAIKASPTCKFVELPQEYTWIIQLTQKWAPGLNPVIMHNRGAKRFKNLIDGRKGYATT